MRKGLGVGRGKGYYNIVPIDTHIHSLSAKGVRTKIKPISKIKKYYEEAKRERLENSKCHYMGCKRTTSTYRNICDYHAQEVENEPYGRYCEFCGVDTFNVKKHKKGCEVPQLFAKSKKGWGENDDDDDESYDDIHDGELTDEPDRCPKCGRIMPYIRAYGCYSDICPNCER